MRLRLLDIALVGTFASALASSAAGADCTSSVDPRSALGSSTSTSTESPTPDLEGGVARTRRLAARRDRVREGASRDERRGEADDVGEGVARRPLGATTARRDVARATSRPPDATVAIDARASIVTAAKAPPRRRASSYDRR